MWVVKKENEARSGIYIISKSCDHYPISCHFTSPLQYRITLFTFIDFKVNNFIFINITYINDISTFLNLKPELFVRLIILKGFDGQLEKIIIHILTLHLSLDGQRQEDISFIILDLRNHDVILSLK